MAPITPKPIQAAPTTNTRAGSKQSVEALAVTAEKAGAEFEKLKGELKKADDAFKKSPGDASLKAKRDALLGKAKAAYETYEKATNAVVESVAKKGTPKEQAAALDAALPGLERKAADATAANTRAIDKLNKALKDIEKLPKHSAAWNKAVDEATELGKAVEKTATKASEADAVVRSAKRGLAARQSEALEGAKGTVPGANDIVDLTDLASRRKDEQIRLVGAPVGGVSSSQATAAAVKRLESALEKGSPENAVKMLALQLKETDPGQQWALIKAARPVLEKVAAAAAKDPKLADLMLAQFRGVSSLGRGELADIMVSTPLGAQMTSTAAMRALSNGDGTIEADAVIRALKKTPQAGLAAPVSQILASKVEPAKAEFIEKAREVEKLNGELARLVVGFGPMMTDAQKQKAIEAFQAQHKEEYADWEAAGKKLAPMLQFALESGDSKLQTLVPFFLKTKAGEDEVMKALALQKEGKPSLLDALPTLKQYGNDGVKAYQQLGTVMAKGVAMRAMELTRAGKLTEAKDLLGTLDKNAKLFGLERSAMESLTKKMGAVLDTKGSKESIKALSDDFKNLESGGPGLQHRSTQALKGLGLALSAASVVDNLRKFDELELKDQIKTIADGIGTGVDGGLLAMEVVGKLNNASKAVHLAKRVSAVAGAVGAVMDGISAVDAFKKGEHAEGIATSASAVGGAILATYAFAAAAGAQALPVAGQVIGAVLVIGGTIAKWTIEERKAQKIETGLENDANAFLQAAGIDKERANKLDDIKRADGRNVGMVVQQLAPRIGMTPKALLEHLVKLSPKQIEAFVDLTKEVELGREGQFKTTGENSLDVTAHWLAEDGLLPKDVKLPTLR